MQGSSNIQQQAVKGQQAVATGDAVQTKRGSFRAESFTATIDAASQLADNAEELAKFTGEKKTRLRVSSKKTSGAKQSAKKVGKASSQSPVNDADFAEEIASLMRLIKKFSKNEDLNSDDEKEMINLLGGMKDDTNEAADQFLLRVESILSKQGRRDGFANQLDKLRQTLDTAKRENKKVDNQFWSDLSKLSILPDFDKSIEGETSRKYVETLNAMSLRLISDYGTDKILAPIAIEIKKIGCEIGQTKNNPERTVILGKEMYVLQSLWTVCEHCTESENKYDRTFSDRVNKENLSVQESQGLGI